MDEECLISAARNGSEEAFALLYKKHLPYVRATGRAVLHTNDLDDLTQDTFLLAFTRLDSFAEHSSFRTWITRIALNQCLMTLRRNRQISNGSHRIVDLDAEGTSGTLLEECVFAVEDPELRAAGSRIDLPKLLRNLKPIERVLLRMAYIHGNTERELARRMGMTPAAVKSKLHHAKQKLRDMQKKS